MIVFQNVSKKKPQRSFQSLLPADKAFMNETLEATAKAQGLRWRRSKTNLEVPKFSDFDISSDCDMFDWQQYAQ